MSNSIWTLRFFLLLGLNPFHFQTPTNQLWYFPTKQNQAIKSWKSWIMFKNRILVRISPHACQKNQFMCANTTKATLIKCTSADQPKNAEKFLLHSKHKTTSTERKDCWAPSLVIQNHGIILCFLPIILAFFGSKLRLEVICCQPELQDINCIFLLHVLQGKAEKEEIMEVLARNF